MLKGLLSKIDLRSMLWEILGVITLAGITQWISHSDRITQHVTLLYVLCRAATMWPYHALCDVITRDTRMLQDLRATVTQCDALLNALCDAQCDVITLHACDDHTLHACDVTTQCDKSDADAQCDKSVKLNNNINIPPRTLPDSSGTIASFSMERHTPAGDLVSVPEFYDDLIVMEPSRHYDSADTIYTNKCPYCGLPEVFMYGGVEAHLAKCKVEELDNLLQTKISHVNKLIDKRLNLKSSIED